MQTATAVRKGDLVQIMVGRDRGKSGKVLRIVPKRARVYVEKLNMLKRHLKPSRAHPQGGVLEREAPLHWSNVMLVCGKCARPVRIRHRLEKKGAKVRVCVKCDEVIGAK